MESKLITSKSVLQCPWYIKICDQLLKLHSPLGSSSELDKRTEISVSNLRKTRKYYTEVAVLYDVLVHCLSVNSANEEITHDDRRKNKMLNDVSEALSLIELQNYITIPSNSKEENTETGRENDEDSNLLFCISKESLRTKAADLITPEHMQVLKIAMEEYLEGQCAQIISFTFPTEEYPTTANGMAAVVEHAKNLQKDTNEKRFLAAKQRQHNGTLLSLVFHQLSEYGNALEALVSKYRVSQSPVLHLEYVSISLKAYFLKLRFIELDVLNKTYTNVSVPALKKLNKDLNSKESKMKQALTQINHRLSAYDGLDYKFQELLKEFASLQKDIRFFQSSVPKR